MTTEERIVVMGFTGITMLVGDCLDKFYDDVDKRLGRVLWTHEYADKELWKEIKEAYQEDFIALCEGEIV